MLLVTRAVRSYAPRPSPRPPHMPAAPTAAMLDVVHRLNYARFWAHVAREREREQRTPVRDATAPKQARASPAPSSGNKRRHRWLRPARAPAALASEVQLDDER
eukprot:SAG25_NODE_6964_length_515_cov_0.795673_1_plen_103_part_01